MTTLINWTNLSSLEKLSYLRAERREELHKLPDSRVGTPYHRNVSEKITRLEREIAELEQ